MQVAGREALEAEGVEEARVVAAALAGLMVARDIPDAELIVATVAVAIVLTLSIQTTTKTWLGRRLGLDERD